MAITNHSCSSVNSNNIFPCEMQTHLSSIFSELTLRECEVLYWFAIGCTIDHIAELMGLKPRTVTYHLDGCKEKLGCTSVVLLRPIYHCRLETARLAKNSTKR